MKRADAIACERSFFGTCFEREKIGFLLCLDWVPCCVMKATIHFLVVVDLFRGLAAKHSIQRQKGLSLAAGSITTGSAWEHCISADFQPGRWVIGCLAAIHMWRMTETIRVNSLLAIEKI